ncbi:arsenate reductase [Raineyella antarctica]|uniref:Arsenate reductase n=1 Tax=Raineyella antarctica TaxID=1577474 RepID=A0A1G6HEB3_9ACTN|nr:hypothetical protein [Raineyella antarctica]SDB92493.1 arsenate reductase [Raineyella antarctica]
MPDTTRPHADPQVDTGLLLEERLDRVTDELAVAFSGSFTRETISRFVAECHDIVTSLLMPPLRPGEQPSPRTNTRVRGLTRRFALERLEALAVDEVIGGERVPEVLFVCVQNAGRSQMAAALMEQLAAGRVRVRSAGSSPGPAVHSEVVEALAEVGLAPTQARPALLTDEAVQAADVVITMGCGDRCPIYPGKRYEDWPATAPVGDGIAGARAIRDELAVRVRELAGSMGLG